MSYHEVAVNCTMGECNTAGQVVSDVTTQVASNPNVQSAYSGGIQGLKGGIPQLLSPVTAKLNGLLSTLPGGLFLWKIVASLVIAWITVALLLNNKISRLALILIFGVGWYFLLSYIGLG